MKLIESLILMSLAIIFSNNREGWIDYMPFSQFLLIIAFYNFFCVIFDKVYDKIKSLIKGE